MDFMQFGAELECIGLHPHTAANVISRALGYTRTDRGGFVDECGRAWSAVGDGSLSSGQAGREWLNPISWSGVENIVPGIAPLQPLAEIRESEYYVPPYTTPSQRIHQETDDYIGLITNVNRDDFSPLNGLAEIRTPPLPWGELNRCIEIAQVLRAAGVFVNSSCGFHVHVDVSRMTGIELTRLARIMYQIEPLFRRAVGVYLKVRESYAKPINGEFIADVMLTKNIETKKFDELINEKSGGKYHGLNLESRHRNTVEFRYFNGTMDPLKMKACIDLACSIVKRAYARKWAAGWWVIPFDNKCQITAWRDFLSRLDMTEKDFPEVYEHTISNLHGEEPVSQKLIEKARLTHKAFIGPKVKKLVAAKKKKLKALDKITLEWLEDWTSTCVCDECMIVKDAIELKRFKTVKGEITRRKKREAA